MIAGRDTLLGQLRRSAFGAWLAAAYALAVLAVALAPLPAAQVFAAEQGAVLCSGNAVPAEGGPAAPLGDLAHCKGCTHVPVFGALPVAATVARMPAIRLAALEPGPLRSLPRGAIGGLPPSRAPPAA